MPPTDDVGRIAERLASVQQDIAEIKKSVRELEKCQHEDSKLITAFIAQMESYGTRISANEKKIEALTDAVTALVFQSKVISWVGLGLGGLILSLLFAIFTGQVRLEFLH